MKLTVKPWKKSALALWAVWAAMFGILEYLGMRRKEDGYPALTNVIKRYVPGWMRAMAVGWLSYHFEIGKASDR